MDCDFSVSFELVPRRSAKPKRFDKSKISIVE